MKSKEVIEIRKNQTSPAPYTYFVDSEIGVLHFLSSAVFISNENGGFKNIKIYMKERQEHKGLNDMNRKNEKRYNR